jgi:hypothetical protein
MPLDYIRAVPTIDLPDDELAAVTAAIRGLTTFRSGLDLRGIGARGLAVKIRQPTVAQRRPESTDCVL